MMHDIYGQAVTTDSADVLAGIDAFMDGFLGNESTAGGILRIANDHPDCVIANAYAASVMMLMESPRGNAKARQYLSQVEANLANTTPRERQVAAATAAWVNGEIMKAIDLGEALAAEHPAELVSAKLCQTQHFNLGNAAGMLRVAERVADAHLDDAHLHGMLAFGYEQCHLLDQAERAARRALELKRKEPWAQHALAHVMLTQGRTDEGTEFLAEVSDTWDGLSSFMYTHIWWHQCLFLLDRAAYEKVLEIYDQHLWGIDKTYSQDQVGAVSMLLRLELHGVDVGDRWQDVADYLTGRLDDHVQPFLDLHYVYGLARAGRAEADQLLNSMDDFAESAHEDVRKRWTDVALPAARGLVAHAQGRHEDASRMLGPTIAAMAQIGGSHAQRELFELVLLDAQIRCGDLLPAQQKLELMRGRDDRAPHVWRQLERVYQGLELPQQAAQARRHLDSLG
jgi:predicted Zn-dependent protease